MSFEERMEQLGRRAVEQEPSELALPRCIRAAECVKPISCVSYRVQRHGFGEGRLPIPATVIRDKDDNRDAGKQQQQQQQQDCDSPGRSARKAGKLLRPSQQQAQQQLDAVKARRSAAKAFSQALDRRNAGLAASSSKGTTAAAAPAPAPARADENHPATSPHGSRRASLTQQPLVERHIPPKTSAGATTSTTAAAAGLAPGSAAAQAHNTVTAADPSADSAEVEGADAAVAAGDSSSSADSAGPAGSTTATQGAAVTATSAAAAGGGANPGSSSCNAGRTFLTDPGSQPPSPAVRRPCAITAGPAADMSGFPTGTATCEAADAESGGGAGPDTAAAATADVGESEGGGEDGTGRAISPELQEYVAYLAAATRVSSSSAVGVDSGTAAVAAGSALAVAAAAADVDGGAAEEGGFDASSRLLWYVHGMAGSAVRPTPREASAAAAGVGAGAVTTSMQASAGGCSSQGAAAPGSSSSSALVPRPGSISPSGWRSAATAGPHWSPVPPQTQLNPPAVVVRPMVGWVPSEPEPQQQVPTAAFQQHPQQQDHHLQQQQQQQQSGSQQLRQQPQQGPVGSNRPPWLGPRDTPAAAKSNVDSIDCKSSGSRHVSRASSSAGGAAARSGARAASGGVQAQPAAAVFHSQELSQLVAAAAEKVAKRRLVLPALCSCGHGTPVLDARYPTRCCSNCPLRGNAAAYESLLAGLLAGMGLE